MINVVGSRTYSNSRSFQIMQLVSAYHAVLGQRKKILLLQVKFLERRLASLTAWKIQNCVSVLIQKSYSVGKNHHCFKDKTLKVNPTVGIVSHRSCVVIFSQFVRDCTQFSRAPQCAVMHMLTCTTVSMQVHNVEFYLFIQMLLTRSSSFDKHYESFSVPCVHSNKQDKHSSHRCFIRIILSFE